MNAERFLELYERVADTADAVAKLRRFVLELAVCGNLVPQDASDEPARALLARIAQRKPKVDVPVARNRNVDLRAERTDCGFAVPSGWEVSTLGTIALKITDGTHKTPTYVAKGVPFVSVKDFSGGRLDLSNTRFVSLEEHRILYRRCDPQRGDLLIGRIGTLGKPVLVDTDTEFSLFVSVGLIRFDHDNILPGYLRLVLSSPYAEREFDRIKVGGGTHTNKLNLSDLHTVGFPVPPFAEQHRIVEKVNELIAMCDKLEAAREEREAVRDRFTVISLRRLDDSDSESGEFAEHARFAINHIALLTRRKHQIKQIRRTILNLAVRGKLVRQDAEDEPASKLLKRLTEAQVAAFASEGLRSRPPVPRMNRDEMWFDFPQAWALSHFDDLFVIVSGVTLGQKVSPDEAVDLPYLRVANVQRGYLELGLIKKITVRRSDEERYALRGGDVLMTEGGDWDKLGRAAIWREEIAGCIHQNHIFRVRPPSKEISPEWVITYVNSALGRSFFEDASKQTTNLASINMSQLRGCPFPLPPLAEQRRIVAKVDELMMICDRLETEIAKSDGARSRLLDTLLSAALDRNEEVAPTEQESVAAYG
jgi:type I restriction enzyme S subunit